MAAQSGQFGPLRFHEAPIATPIAIPTASQTPMLPAITPKTAPSAAPTAMPNPTYLGLLCITNSYADFSFRFQTVPQPHALRRGGRGRPPLHELYALGNSGGFGTLAPIALTLPSSSEIGMPESVSNRAGTCAAIFAMSPVILFIPAASPFPVETIVILSTFASGAANAFTISGMLANSLSMTAAWLYS